ncbi:hypothetical protein [Uliginosibacterium gangwonense]|uniref:hypothetical protein n=1 Tax=Uliginosibacterium gangwonense TaxID=392736 RepID=UPI00037669C2|nr:hypothetical protein [Uliginosibacterium gangwonense]
MTSERTLKLVEHHEFHDESDREREGYLAEVAELGKTVEMRELAPRASAMHEVEETMHMGAFGV